MDKKFVVDGTLAADSQQTAVNLNKFSFQRKFSFFSFISIPKFRSGFEFFSVLMNYFFFNLQNIWKLRENAAEAMKHVGYVYKQDFSLPIRHFYEVVEIARKIAGDLATEVKKKFLS